MEPLSLILIKWSLKEVASQDEGGTEGFLDKSLLG